MSSFVSLKNCLSEPKQLLKLIVLIICICVASYQLSECFRKIIHPPISTYYSFKLNDSITYPAVTICRNPGYKTEYFPKYGLSADNSIITYSSVWREFNYSAYTLSEFFEETTYTLDEILAIIAFEGYSNNVDIKSFYLVKYGRCFTINAIKPSHTFSETGGYIFQFRHTETVKLRNNFGISLSGYHIFIHDPAEVITAAEAQENSFMQYLYLEAGEDLRVNLRVQKYNQIHSRDNVCDTSANYSKSKCEEECIFRQITDMFNCTAPWINIDGIDKSECSEYRDQVRNLLLYYTTSYRDRYLEPCDCQQTCNISVYSTYVQSRKEVSMPDSNLSLYFSSNLITIMDEVHGYDWNVFLSDIGGSLGFLLGLSVIGFISLTEQIVLLLVQKSLRNKEKKSIEAEKLENEMKSEANNNNCKQLMIPQIKIDCDDTVTEKNYMNNSYSGNLLTKENNNEKSLIIEKY